MRTFIPAARERGCLGRASHGLRIALLCLVAAWTAVAAGGAGADELQTKAKFVYQLTKYVKWPEGAHASPEAPLTIGVVDAPLLAATLSAVSTGKRVRGHPIEVVVVSDPEQTDVHLLLLPGRGRSTLRRLAHRHQDGNVLTVAEEFDFPELGGDVGIELIDGRVSFSINRRKMNRGEFEISSKLMRLASEVK